MPGNKKSLLRRVKNGYDHFAIKLARNSKSIADESVLVKTRSLLILWTYTCLVMWLYVLYCFLAFGAGYPVPWGGLAFTIIHTTVPLVYYITQSIEISGIVLSLSGLGFQTLFCVYTGGIYSPAAIWLTLHPVILGFFGNSTLILFSVILNFCIVVSLYFYGLIHHLPLSVLPANFRDGMIISSYVGLDILVAAFTVVAIRINTKRNSELQNARELTENLLRVLCHDINNPLTIIQSSSKHLTPEELKAKPQHAERIRKACDDIFGLTRSIGSWMAYRDGKITLSSSSVPLKEIIDHIHFSFEDKLKDKELSLNITAPDGHYAVLGDKTAINYQIYSNLISNAVKFSFEKSKIDVHFFVEGDFIVTKVRDYGVGINPQIIDKVFSPYDRTTSKGTRNERGNGFGMPIVATVVERMRGKIWVENLSLANPEERGTLFTVKLPRALI